jgi:cysteine desulfurase / selenocysteine lyase
MSDHEWTESVRSDFPALRESRNGKPPIYFDNACTTLVPADVIEAMNEYYRRFPACGGTRGTHWFAREINHRIEGDPEEGLTGSRQTVRDFINARYDDEIIFTLNTTHSINLVALGFDFRPGDGVLLTEIEHNSNLIPWLRLQNRRRIEVEHIPCGEDYTFDFDQFRQRLATGRVRLVSMAYTSNLTGHTIPAAEIVRMAHECGALVLLDAAQTIPHQTVDVQALDVDFLAFSLHKMCGPKATGVLYAKRELTQDWEDIGRCVLDPAVLGGGTVADTNYEDYALLPSPERFEAGVQNYAGQIAAGAAITYLRQIGIDKIAEHERRLNSFLTEELLDRYGKTGWFRILGPKDASRRAGILTFEVGRPNAVGIAEELDQGQNIMIRYGAFCNHSYLNKIFGQGWALPRLPSEQRMTYRVSGYLYNTIDECRLFVEALHGVFTERGYV